ncbi:hypothetical protein P5V15_003299 [Pogonomyrmex californicus]
MNFDHLSILLAMFFAKATNRQCLKRKNLYLNEKEKRNDDILRISDNSAKDKRVSRNKFSSDETNASLRRFMKFLIMCLLLRFLSSNHMHASESTQLIKS